MPAAAISPAQAISLRQASAKAIDAARELLASSERQTFDTEEGLTLLFESLGCVLAVFPAGPDILHRAVMNANFGMLTPERAKKLAGLQ